MACEEELDGGTLIASDLYVREDDSWRIARHQAGQLVARRPQVRRTERPPGTRLNSAMMRQGRKLIGCCARLAVGTKHFTVRAPG